MDGLEQERRPPALNGVHIEEIDLHGQLGIALAGLADVHDHYAGAAPVATLLPALDPTPMGWKGRDWFLGIDRGQVFDSAGNIGPTLWWDGEIVGSWAIGPAGGIRTKLLADRGAAAEAAVTRPRPCCTTVSKVQSSRPRSARPSSARSRTASPLPGPPDL